MPKSAVTNEEIIALLKEGLTRKEAAKQLGLTASAISKRLPGMSFNNDRTDYTPEQKQQAMDTYRLMKDVMSVKDIADMLAIPKNTLANWINIERHGHPVAVPQPLAGPLPDRPLTLQVRPTKRAIETRIPPRLPRCYSGW